MNTFFKHASIAVAVSTVIASAQASTVNDTGINVANTSGAGILINNANSLPAGSQPYGNLDAGIVVSSPQGIVIVSDNNGNSTGNQGVAIYSNGNADARINLEGNNSSFFATGTTSINSGTATNINTTGTGAVTIGNASNTTTIQSGTNVITGANNSMLATSTNTITATTTNNINSATNNITATTANNIQGPLNNIGTSTTSTNNIGNSNTATQVHATGNNAQMNLYTNNASLTVPSGAAGVNNGFVATNTNSAMTGGNTNPTRLTMNDSGANFSRVSNGQPVTVTGVADGRNDYDAVNVRQYAGAIAAVAAQANLPALAAGQDRSIGLGLGNFMGKTGLAVGMNLRDQNTVYKLSLSSGLNGGAQTVFAGGVAWAW